MTCAEQVCLTPVHVQHVILRHKVNNVPFSSYGAICYPLKKPYEAKNLPWFDFDQLGLVVMTYNDRLGIVHEAMIDMHKIRQARHFMTQTKICPYSGNSTPFYKYCDEAYSPFSNENMSKLHKALLNPNEPSYPKQLRTVDTLEVHKRLDKSLQLLEFQNWLESGYNMSIKILTAYKVECIKLKTKMCLSDLFNLIKEHIQKDIGQTNNDNNNTDIDENPTEQTENRKVVNITIKDIVQYALKQKWIYSANQAKESVTPDAINEGNIPNNNVDKQNIDVMLLNCCEELELLSREYSNEEGENSSVACGAMLEVETEHPDYIIKKGIDESVLKRMPFPDPQWDNPLPEHTPGYLQKSFPFVFLSGHGCPYEDRPRDIKNPISSWETEYMDWVSKQPAAAECPRLQFLLHGRAQRIAGRKQVQVAIINVGIDKDNLPTKEELSSYRRKS